MESVPAFLDELAARLVPECDPAVVQAVFARASAGYTGPRGRDGQRVTAIAPSGVPFEASVTSGAGRSSAALRYVTETATGMPFFQPRVAAQCAALDDLVRWLPPPARAAAGELTAAVEALFPDPAAVPARRRFATTFGIVHRADVPDGLAGLKLYGNLRAGERDSQGSQSAEAAEPPGTAAGGALARVSARWPALAHLAELLGDLVFLQPHFTTVEVDADGRVAHKLYVRTRRANATGLTVMARRFGTELGPVADALRRLGVSDDVWGRRFFVCGAVSPASPPGDGHTGDGHTGVGHTGDGPRNGRAGDEPPGDLELSLHLSAKALMLDAAGMAGLARGLLERHGDTTALDALEAATRRAGGPASWATTVIGLGLAPGGGVGKVNVYTSALAAIVRG